MSHFNKRHYEAIATVLQQNCPDLPMVDGEYDDTDYDHDALGRQLMWDDMREAIADMLASDNSRFDRSRFLHACKPGSNVKARTAHLNVA